MTSSNEPTAAELFRMAVGDRIREWREALELSVETVSKRSGLHVRQIEQFETGSGDLTITSLQALALALEAEPYELIDVGGEELGIAAGARSFDA